MSQGALSDFLALVRRELGADDARIVEAVDEVPAGDAVALRQGLSRGRMLVVSYATAPADLEARGRRLELLVSSFDSLLEGPHERDARPPPAQSLREELRALAERAGAIDALVIDARSPVLWGSAIADASTDTESRRDPTIPPPPSIHGDSKLEAEPANDLDDFPPACRRAIAAVRGLHEIETLHKGGHLNASVALPQFGYVAQSFAAIYVLVLAFGGPFDEIRARRAVQLALPAIERLVLALPPHDPPPHFAGVIALRPRRRR